MGFRDVFRGLFDGDSSSDASELELPENWEIVGGDVVEDSDTTDQDDEHDRPPIEAFPPEEAAEALSAQWSAYDLDFSPASLARLDDLIGTELSPSQYEMYGFRLGAYLGEVLVRNHDADWIPTEDAGWVVEMPNETGGATVVELTEPVQESLWGDVTFSGAYEQLVTNLGLGSSPAGDDATPEANQKAPGVDRKAPEESEEATDAEYYQDRAERIAWTWPAYDLDFSVESLVRLDRLVEDEFEPGTGGPGDGLAGYLAEVFRRHHDAAWQRDRGEAVLVICGTNGAVELTPEELAAAREEPEQSFVETYAQVAADLGLRTLADER